jgi:integrase
VKVDAAPPFGVDLKVDVEEHDSQSGTRYWARVRWHDPDTGERKGIKRSHQSLEDAEDWAERMRKATESGIDPGQTLSSYVDSLGERWARGIDKTSTYHPYSAGLKLRVLPTLGHLPVAMITAGLVDRAIDGWEEQYSRSTVKNSVSALVLVLDEAVRDGIVLRNPAKDRARRRTMGIDTGNEIGANPRDLALPDVATLDLLVERVADAGNHRSYGDMVTILATTALRISEVSGLQVGDVDLERGLLTVARQTYPGRGGLVTKQTKGRRRRAVPIIDPLRPTLERLTAGREPDELLVKGPRGGVITTATLRDATGWDDLVADLGLAGLVRHGLRHTALTWMADAGVDLHLLQRVAGHQDPAVTARYLHPDHEAVLEAGRALSAWWARQAQASGDATKAAKPAARSGSGPAPRRLGVVKGRGLGA